MGSWLSTEPAPSWKSSSSSRPAFKENEPYRFSSSDFSFETTRSTGWGNDLGQPHRYGSRPRRMYGFFKCSNCRNSWESSHVYCKAGTSEVYGQQCERCKVMCKPYLVENLKCSDCGFEDCICIGKKERHIDLAKHHRKDLCAKCKAGLPCV